MSACISVWFYMNASLHCSSLNCISTNRTILLVSGLEHARPTEAIHTIFWAIKNRIPDADRLALRPHIPLAYLLSFRYFVRFCFPRNSNESLTIYVWGGGVSVLVHIHLTPCQVQGWISYSSKETLIHWHLCIKLLAPRASRTMTP